MIIQGALQRIVVVRGRWVFARSWRCKAPSYCWYAGVVYIYMCVQRSSFQGIKVVSVYALNESMSATRK